MTRRKSIHRLKPPIHIYGKVAVSFLTFLFPFAFIAYYPAHHFFQIVPQETPAFFPYISPLVAGVSLTIAIIFWSLGVKHYQSTGT